MEPGSNWVTVSLGNVSAKQITIPFRAVVCQVQLANMVPKLQTPKEQDTIEQKGQDNTWILDQLDLDDTERWSGDQQQAAKNLLCEYSGIFSKKSFRSGKCNILTHNIKLTGHQPFKERYRRILSHLFEEVKQHLQEMVEIGAIRKSFSPWISAVVFVWKKDGGLRLCTDLHKLNNCTVKDGYALPRIEDTLDCLHGAVWFSTLHLKSGYWQVELEEEAKPLIAFKVGPLGFWECGRMPFGLTNAPANPSKVDGVLPW